MNIEKIFTVVSEDEMNSSLAIIVWELEKQGYAVKLEGVDVTADDMENELFSDLERATNELTFELINGSETKQKFRLVFTGYHKFNFQRY